MKQNISNQILSTSWKQLAFLGVLSTSLILGSCKKNEGSDPATETTNIKSSKETATTSGAIGSGWVEITSTEENEYDNQFESITSGVKTRPWSTSNWYMDIYNNLTSTWSTNSALGYLYNSTYNEHRFSMFKYPGKRSEIRVHDDYLTGSRQFEGYIIIDPNVFSANAVFQILGGTSTATLMQIRANGADGTLNVYQNGGLTTTGSRYIASGITNVSTRINVIHKQQTSSARGKVYIYVNGALKFTFEENENPTNTTFNYMKFGNYGRYDTDNAKTNSIVKWKNVRLWRDGTV
jgi:hypothetical protein